ncbi:MAG: hypothetical protein JXQ73_22130 [Phycisphaerae bacterium]|nr:hypothetical protein [Phycisphaerae bacterium]
MNQLERFRATCAHQRPDRLLYAASFTPDLHRRLAERLGTDDFTGHYEMFAPVPADPRPPKDHRPPDFSEYYEDANLPENATISEDGPAMVPSGFYHFWGYVSPLRNAASLDELEAYPLDDHTTYETDHLAAVVAEAHADGRVAVGNVVHMYETSWQIRGYEEFLIDLITQPEWAECILDKVARRCKFRAVAAARAGADYLMCGDDVANQNALMFSADVWRTFIKSRWADVWAAARSVRPDIEIFYHSDGNIMSIIPELIEIGVTILNPVQPECVDPKEIKRLYGDKVVLHGTIGTQSTMPFGTSDDVRQTVKQRVDTLAADGALMLAPTHVLEPEVPIENVEAFFDACREYGRLA